MRTTTLAGIALAAALAAMALAPSSSSAQARRPLYFGFGAGPHAYFDCCADVHGRIEGEFGWHPSGRDEGFFLAANATGTFGRQFGQFYGGLRLGGDISVYNSRDITVFLRPSGLFGAGFHDWDGPSNTYGFFVIQPAFDVKLAFGDHLFQVYFRPVAIDIYLWPDYPHDGRDGDFGANVGYTAMGGMQFAF